MDEYLYSEGIELFKATNLNINLDKVSVDEIN